MANQFHALTIYFQVHLPVLGPFPGCSSCIIFPLFLPGAGKLNGTFKLHGKKSEKRIEIGNTGNQTNTSFQCACGLSINDYSLGPSALPGQLHPPLPNPCILPDSIGLIHSPSNLCIPLGPIVPWPIPLPGIRSRNCSCSSFAVS